MASKFDGYWQNDGVMNASRLIAITGTGGDHFLVAKIVYRNTLTDALEDDCTFLCTVEMQGSESVLEQRIVRPREDESALQASERAKRVAEKMAWLWARIVGQRMLREKRAKRFGAMQSV